MNTMNRVTGFRENETKYFFKETVTDATSDPLKIPNVNKLIGVALVPGTNAKVQYTFSSYDDINDGNAVWFDWEKGEVSKITADVSENVVSALRLVSTGESAWEVTV